MIEGKGERRRGSTVYSINMQGTQNTHMCIYKLAHILVSFASLLLH